MNSYTFHITLYDVFFFAMIFVGLTFALLLGFVKSVNRNANRFLALALVTMILWMARVVAIDIRLESHLPHWDRMPTQFLLALGPLMYFYVLMITRPQYKFRWRDALHFSPLLLEQAVWVFEINERAKTGTAAYTKYTLQLLHPALQLLIFISIIIYLRLSGKLIQTFYRGLHPVLMDSPLIEFRWLRRLLAATALLWCFWIACAAIDFFGFQNHLGSRVYYPFYIFFVVIIIWTAVAAFLKPQAAVIAQTPPALKPVVLPELRAKGARLTKTMETNLYYQDPELSLSSLAEKLNMHPHELSKLINTIFKKSFTDLINEYRVRDVIGKMRDPAYDGLTMVGIAFEAGFNSKTTFNRTFKQMTGKSPAEFKNALEKDGPSYQLGPGFRPAAVISNHQTTIKWNDVKLNRNYMFRSYFIVAFRNFSRNRIFSAINITGLSIGISAALVIFLIVSYDVSFDRFEKDGSRIYRVVSEMKFSGQPYYNPGVPEPLANTIKTEVTGVQLTTQFLQPNVDMRISLPGSDGRQTIFKKQQGIIFTVANYFDFIGYQWLAGNAADAMAKPMQVVLTESRAKLYFPAVQPADVLGKVVTYNDSIPVTVAGVVKDITEQTDFIFKEFISLPTTRTSAFKNSFALDNWYSTDGTSQLIIKLAEQNNTANVEKQLAGLIHKYRSEQKQDAQNSYLLKLQPLSDLHFNSNYGTFVQWDSGDRTGIVSKTVLYGLTIAGALLLLLGCVNFINMSTALATARAKEVGVRKTMGSSKLQLRMQFICETFFITFIATLVSVALVPLLLKMFAGFIPQGVRFTMLMQPWVLLFLGGLLVTVTLLAGFYPSIILSNYNPVDVLKNRPSTGGGSRKTRLRKTLTIAQFTIAQAFIMGAIVVGNQIHYLLNTDIGFKKDAVVFFYINTNGPDNNRRTVLAERLKALPGVAMVSLANDPPSSTSQWTGPWVYNGSGKQIETSVHMKYADTGYARLFGMRILAGQNITPGDTMRDVVINETYARALGFTTPKQAIGKMLDRKGKRLPIAGVVADFNMSSLHEQIKPLAILTTQENEYCVNVLLTQSNNGTAGWQKTISSIAEQYKALYPQQDFDYHFLDDSIAQFYKSERDVAVLLNWATGLAIVISCMGLLGLVIYTTNSRIKEIGVRKILGAPVSGIIALLSQDFIKLVSVAFIIAMPIAWWGAQQWLQGFAYRTKVSWWMFVATGLSMVLLAIITLSVQVVKAALANPVKSLRTE